MHDPDFWEAPECAIRTFEELTGLHLTVHDIGVPLWPYLPPERFKHRSPCCLAVKARHDWACMDFEVTRLRKEIHQHPEGRCHQCHAGLVEWVIPAFIEGRLAWIFFAGQARLEGPYERIVRDSRSTPFRREGKVAVPAIAEARSAVILEALRQLRARLLEWLASMQPAGEPASSSRMGLGGKERTSRAHAIRKFLFDHHAEDPSVADLARRLGLGESRTIHVVKELFGCGFAQLLNQTRLKTAASLLRNTSLPVQEVCYESGFQDLSHFHRTFLRQFGMTPLRYRRAAGT